MKIKNSSSSYGFIAILFHWFSVLTVIGLFALGWWMVDLSYYDPWYSKAPSIHKAVGVLFTVWLALRIIWRWINPKPKPIGSSTLLNRLAELVHITLYLLLIFLIVTGYMIIASDSRPLDVFGLLRLPADWQIFSQQETLMGNWHRWLAYLLSALVTAHALVALKHHFINKDDTIKRMIGRV